MKRFLFVSLFMSLFTVCHAGDMPVSANLICSDYSWSDVELLVQPYLSDDMYTTLVMQGQSAGYKTSAAAEQVMGEALPDVIKRILRAIIDADC